MSERDERKARQQCCHGERRHVLIVVVERFDLERHGIGEPANMPAHHRDGAELAHRARVAKKNPVEKPPADVGKRHAQKRLQPGCAERRCRLFLPAPLICHERDQLARDKGKGHEDRGKQEARKREDDLDVMVTQEVTEPALESED